MALPIFNPAIIQKYETLLGREKLLALWTEFKSNTSEKLDMLDELFKLGNKSEIRLIFHNASSAALVFGLEDFAKLCSEIEEVILNDDDLRLDEQLLQNCLTIFNESVRLVDSYFKL